MRDTVAYTIGNKTSYDQALDGTDYVMKVGACEGYEGGWVWKTQVQAQAFIATHELEFPAKVYGLLLPGGWAAYVSPEPADDGVHRLLNDAQVVGL